MFENGGGGGGRVGTFLIWVRGGTVQNFVIMLFTDT